MISKKKKKFSLFPLLHHVVSSAVITKHSEVCLVAKIPKELKKEENSNIAIFCLLPQYEKIVQLLQQLIINPLLLIPKSPSSQTKTFKSPSYTMLWKPDIKCFKKKNFKFSKRKYKKKAQNIYFQTQENELNTESPSFLSLNPNEIKIKTWKTPCFKIPIL